MGPRGIPGPIGPIGPQGPQGDPGILSAVLGGDGYVKLGGNLVIQWGVHSGGTYNPQITFPTPFASDAYVVVASSTEASRMISITAKTRTTFNAESSNHNSLTIPSIFYWIAIGK
jgi:hypothetical protein